MLYGCGREGLQMRGLAMRLYHLGLQANMVGDMATLSPRNYLTAPAAIPLIIYFSRKIATITNGSMAADDNAAMDHQLIP